VKPNARVDHANAAQSAPLTEAIASAVATESAVPTHRAEDITPFEIEEP